MLAAATRQTRAVLNAKLAEINSAAHGRNQQALADMEHNAQVIGDALEARTVVGAPAGATLGPTEVVSALATATKKRDALHRQAKAAQKVDVVKALMKL